MQRLWHRQDKDGKESRKEDRKRLMSSDTDDESRDANGTLTADTTYPAIFSTEIEPKSPNYGSTGSRRASVQNEINPNSQNPNPGFFRSRSQSVGAVETNPNRMLRAGERSSSESGRSIRKKFPLTMHADEEDLNKQLDYFSGHYASESQSSINTGLHLSPRGSTVGSLFGVGLGTGHNNEEWEEFVEKMRHVLRLHFLTPWQKWNIRGLLPLRSIIHFLSVIIFASQLIVYAKYQQEFQLFMDENRESFHHLFIMDWDPEYSDPIQKTKYPDSIYTPQDLAQHIEFAVDQYFTLDPRAIGNWTFCNATNPDEVSNEPISMQLCFYQNEFKDDNTTDNMIEISTDPKQSCAIIEYPVSVYDPEFDLSEFLEENFEGYSLPGSLALFQSMHLKFYLLNQHFGALNVFFEPNCYRFELTLIIDNQCHTGQDPVSLEIDSEALDCGGGKHNITVYTLANDGKEYTYVILSGCLDTLTIFWSILLFIMIVKSVRRNWGLCKVVRKFWLVHKQKKLEMRDQLEFFNFWNILIVISCGCMIVGSSIKLLITTERIMTGYSECAVFLGLGVMLDCIATLQNFTYSSHFNLLILAMKAAAPDLFRFLVCIIFFTVGNSLFAWIAFGGYHYKFATYGSTLQTMFSLMNGDDIFNTFAEMPTSNRFVYVLNQIWLTVFTTLYICFVVGLIIAIVSETYHEVNEGRRRNRSEVEQFMNENNEAEQSQYFEKTTTRLRWKEAFLRFVRCQDPRIDFDRMHVTFEK